MSSANSIVQILWRYKNHEDLSETELAELKEWLEESSLHEDLFEELSNTAKWDRQVAPLLARDSNASWSKIRDRIEELSKPDIKRKRLWMPYAAAAVVVVLVGLGFLMEREKKPAKKDPVISNISENRIEILPAANQVSLTLSDDRIIQLDSAVAGQIANEESAKISVYDSGLNYISDIPNDGPVRYNSLKTGRGSTYKLTLADGSRVWLNAGSQIRYPVVFSSVTRSVELEGEAYFEVAKDKLKPFIVRSGDARVRVLGTHFDIRSYAGDVSRTTLLEGSVIISNATDSLVIKPGQQVSVGKDSSFHVENANPDQVLAWRKNLFWFRSTPFTEIMQELSRHYDIDVTFTGPVHDTFTGILPQQLPLSALLAILEKGGNVHFRTSGNKLVVSP